MKPNKDERSLYVEAAKSSAVSKTLDKIFKIIVSLTLIAILVTIGIAQYRYQENNREITKQRNVQLSEIKRGNEDAKAHIICAVTLRNSVDESNVAKLQECVVKQMEERGWK